MSWYQDKAAAFVRAWRRHYGADPTKHAVVMCCAVAALETRCGDSWKCSHNWGAIQIPRGVTVDPQFAEPHGDSSPINGPYVTNFWRFPDGWTIYPPAGLSGDEAGAWKLIQVLLEQRPKIKARIHSITPYELALLMYTSGYYEGTHSPKPKPGEVVDGLTEGQKANIACYTGPPGGISANAAAFERGLADWDPASVQDLSDEDQQRAIHGVMQALKESIDEGADSDWGSEPDEDTKP